MFCPKCKTAYGPGVTKCSNCQVALVAEAPATDEHEDADKVTFLIPELPRNWDPASATTEVWRGSDERTRSFVVDALRGIGIPTRHGVDNMALFVRPEDAERSHEIIRQIREGVEPTATVQGIEYRWQDQPIRSITLLWAVPLVAFVVLWILLVAQPSLMEGLGPIWKFVLSVGWIWMLYQAFRYEPSPWRFVLLSFVPFSFVWYYNERYRQRRGLFRLPTSVRMRAVPPPGA